MPESKLSLTELDYYHCTFFLPLFGLNDENFLPPEDFYQYCPDSEHLSVADKQAYRYFSPTLRKILFECKPESDITALREWRLNASLLEHWQLRLDPQTEAVGEAYRYTIVACFKEVRLFRYFNGIYILSFRVEADDIEAQSLLETWLHFTRLARVLYMTFPEQKAENKLAPVHIYDTQSDNNLSSALEVPSIELPEFQGSQISPVVRFLLQQFTTLSNEKLNTALNQNSQFYDDRLFVSVAYGIAGKQLSTKELQRILYLAMWVDRFEDTVTALDDYVYSENSLKQMSEGKTLDLWEGRGGRFAFTDYSNAYVYRDSESPSELPFFRAIMAPHHIPYTYDRMLVQALFYQASLRLYDDRISEQTVAILDSSQLENIKEQRREFIQFTNRYWFHTLTEQMQGKAIFNLQKQGLGLQEHYDIIKDELERTDEYLQTVREVKLNKITDKFTRGGLVIALIALYYAVLPIVDSIYTANQQSFWVAACAWFGVTSMPVLLLIIIFGIPLGIALVVLYAPRFFSALKKKIKNVFKIKQ